jgi:hypothetical protein
VRLIILSVSLFALAGCGPRAHIPQGPLPAIGALPDSDSAARLARSLAPVLYVQRDEWFGLERVVAVVNPTRPIVAYHLLWKDDINGSEIPFTVPTDEELVWVGYDSTNAATDIWTYWHGKIVHTPWRDRGQPAIDVQWGKHGSLPHGIIESDLPGSAKLNVFYALTWLTLPDIWLGRLTRPGPLCFCHGYGRYRDFSRVMPLADALTVVVRTADAAQALTAVFGHYSHKPEWPDSK